MTNPGIESRITALLQEMTLEEKIGQMVYLNFGDQEPVDAIRRGEVGLIANVESAERMNRLQKIAIEESRLGIPILFGNDVIHGYRTIFPIPLAEACSWEPKLFEETAEWAAKEAVLLGTHLIFAPMVDICRDPRWGRISEGAGEDPYLVSCFSEAKVRGFQGSHWEDAATAAACVKHFVAYGASEGGRDYDTIDISLQTLHEIFLPPFRQAVKAGVQMVMSSFNDFNGIPTAANRYLLTDVLRKGLAFSGVIIGDHKCISKLITQGVATDRAEACKKAIFAGMDMDMNSEVFTEHLANFVRSGEIPETVIHQAAARLLRIKFTNRLFEFPYAQPNSKKLKPLNSLATKAARKSAQRSVVLLKNEDSLLPLKKSIRKLALIGPLANEKSVLGCWSCFGDVDDAITVLEGLRCQCEPGMEILYTKGCAIEDDNKSGFAKAIEITRQSDVAVIVVGEAQDMSGESRCRSELSLPGVQEDLIHTLSRVGKPLIVVLMNGRPLTLNRIVEEADALVEAWFLGSQTGNAIADILFGRYNPSGKLAVTLPRSVGQIPIYYNRRRSGRPDVGVRRFATRYIDIPSDPLFPFGFGLSFTQFAYDNLRLSHEQLQLNQTLTVNVDIKNIGEQFGEEIVQLYIQDVVASMTRPSKELKGFKKIPLYPGETAQVEFKISPHNLGFYNADVQYIVEPGEFKVWVGPNSDEGLESSFRLMPEELETSSC